MRLIDAPRGSFVTRNWNQRNALNRLRIYVDNTATDVKNRPKCYYESSNTNEFPRLVLPTSTAWHYNDFVFCDTDGNILKTQPHQKDTIMATHYSASIIVATNSNSSASFDTEASALEWIAGKLEEAPRTKFKMFKPYQTVEPQIPDLSSLIKKIEN